jgi:hypothetical protein
MHYESFQKRRERFQEVYLGYQEAMMGAKNI